MNNYYKIFFTITFDYSENKNKVISKFFKSDVDLAQNDFKEKLDDKSIFKLWKKYALQNPLNTLNPENEFDEKKTSNKRITTHRIVNLKTLTEVFTK